MRNDGFPHHTNQPYISYLKDRSMTLKVTFDTNVFTRFIDLEKGLDKIHYENILKAIRSEAIRGYFSDTFVTLEGIMKIDRERILGSRRISFLTSSESPNRINITIGTSMCEPNLHDSHLCTVSSLLKLGLWGLRGLAYLGDNFSVPSNIDLYESISVDALRQYRERMGNVEIAIANRNQKTDEHVGKCRARELGLKWLKRDQRDGEIWYQGLGLAKDKPESQQIVKAIAEWADGESIIRHIGYGNGYFCTSDKGKSANGASIFDDSHREWLACEFGVKFVTPKELSEVISRS